MKKLTFLILVLWQHSTVWSQTSIYHEFPDSNAIWNVSWVNSGLQDCGKYSISISSTDILIKGNSYHQIIQKTYNKTVITNSSNPQYPTGYFFCQYNGTYVTANIAAIREDILQKKVYIIPHGDTIPQLLYDFNLQVGDTLKGYLSFCNGCNTVTSVDSILINSAYRTRWNFGNPSQTSIIEGIGSSDGLLTISDGFEYSSDLDCFSQDDKSLYPTYDANSGCVYITSVSENKEMEKNVSIFPNPSEGKFQIKLKVKATMLEITDVLGNKILESGIENDIVELDLTIQPKGIYFARISGPSIDFIVEKIMKN